MAQVQQQNPASNKSEQPAMEVYTWKTPNGYKVTIMLEELGIPYKLNFVDISKGEQFNERYLKFSPNNKIPALVDRTDSAGGTVSMFESGAILLYLADKYRKLIPQQNEVPQRRANVLSWLFWQMSGLGPMFGQLNHFTNYASEKVPYAIERYKKESMRLLGVLERHLLDELQQQETSGGDSLKSGSNNGLYLCNGELSIADITNYTWIKAIFARESLGRELNQQFPTIKQWMDGLAKREAFNKGMQYNIESKS